MKKWTLLLLSLLLLVCCTACAGVREEEHLSADSRNPVPFLALEVPEAAQAVELASAFQASDDYGAIYPYYCPGESLGFGLADAAGQPLTGLQFRGAYADYEQGYLNLYYPPPAFALDEPWQTYQQIVRADGSWASEVYLCQDLQLLEDRLIVEYGIYAENAAEWGLEDWPENEFTDAYLLYDLQARLLRTGIGMIHEFQEGLAFVDAYYPLPGEARNWWGYFIDRDGRVVIPGPFYGSYGFEDGQARVMERVFDPEQEYALPQAQFGLIDREGNYLQPLSADNPYALIMGGCYELFSNDYEMVGLRDRQGQTVVEPMYHYIYSTHSWSVEDRGWFIALDINEQVWFLDTETGETWPLASEEIWHGEDGWFAAAFWPEEDEGEGLVFYHQGQEISHYQGQRDKWPYAESLFGSVFSIEEHGREKAEISTLAIFDAASGEVLRRLDFPCHFVERSVDGAVFVFADRQERYFLLDRQLQDWTPEALAGQELQYFHSLGNGVYQVATEQYYGLLDADFAWLLQLPLQ